MWSIRLLNLWTISSICWVSNLFHHLWSTYSYWFCNLNPIQHMCIVFIDRVKCTSAMMAMTIILHLGKFSQYVSDTILCNFLWSNRDEWERLSDVLIQTNIPKLVQLMFFYLQRNLMSLRFFTFWSRKTINVLPFKVFVKHQDTLER